MFCANSIHCFHHLPYDSVPFDPVKLKRFYVFNSLYIKFHYKLHESNFIISIYKTLDLINIYIKTNNGIDYLVIILLCI